MRIEKTCLLLILGFFVLKIVLSALFPLAHDEAYYWVWGQNLQLSYFDHPPLVSWLTYLGSVLDIGFGTVRLPAIILGTLTFFLWIRLLRPYLTDVQLNSWLLITLFSPLVGWGLFFLLPDVPLLFAWTLAIYFLDRFLRDKKTLDAFLLGLVLGVGFLAKYHIVIFVPILLVYLSCEKKWKEISLHQILFAALAGLLVTTPVLLWNQQNSWISFLFQMNHGLGGKNWSAHWTWGYLAGQVILIFPIFIWFASRAKVPAPLRMHLYFAWGPLLFFFLTSFRGIVEMNWPSIAYPSLFVLTVLAMPNRFWIWIHAAIWSLAIAFCIFVYQKKDSTWAPVKLREGYQYEEFRNLPLQYSPLYASSYQMASQLWYLSQTPVYKLRDMSRFDFYDMKTESLPQVAPFYVFKTQAQKLPQWVKDQGYTSKLIEQWDSGYDLIEVSR